jgi:hypothetical protein
MTPRSLVLALGLFACGSDLPPIGDKPVAPESNDPAFAIRSIHDWYLAGNAATPGEDQMTFFVDAAAGTEYVDAWVANLQPIRMSKQSDGSFGAQVAIGDVPTGTHEVLLAADGSDTAFAKVGFRRSAPYYVLVTTDWDFAIPRRDCLSESDAPSIRGG